MMNRFSLVVKQDLFPNRVSGAGNSSWAFLVCTEEGLSPGPTGNVPCKQPETRSKPRKRMKKNSQLPPTGPTLWHQSTALINISLR